MLRFEEKPIYDSDKNIRLKSLNERFIRWQEKQISLLTFSINLFFTFALTAFGLIINNIDSPFFNSECVLGYSTLQWSIYLILFSIISGVLAILCRLFDFRLTSTIIHHRKLAFKLKNKVKYESKKVLTTKTIQDKIQRNKCFTLLLGNATWMFFISETFFFILFIVSIAIQILQHP